MPGHKENGYNRHIFHVGYDRFLLLFFRQRKREDEFCSNTLRADYIDIFIVCLNDFFYNRKPKTGSFFIFSTGKITLVKSFPDLVDT